MEERCLGVGCVMSVRNYASFVNPTQLQVTQIQRAGLCLPRIKAKYLWRTRSFNQPDPKFHKSPRQVPMSPPVTGPHSTLKGPLIAGGWGGGCWIKAHLSVSGPAPKGGRGHQEGKVEEA